MADPDAELAPVLGWVREHARPLTAAGEGLTGADRQSLTELIGDAQVVGLGEPAHGAAEIFDLKGRVIEFLVSELGFTVCAWEASYAGGRALDGHLQHGDGHLATALSGLGYLAWDTAEVAGLLRRLRAANERAGSAERVAFWGLDTGFSGAGHPLVARYLSDHLPQLAEAASSTLAEVSALEQRWPFELTQPQWEAPLGQVHERLSALEAAVGSHAGAAPSAETVEVLRHLRLMRHWSGPDRHDRSRQMGDTLLDLLGAERPGARVAVWAHNWHIGRGSNAPGANLGDVLAARFGTAYRPLAFQFLAGTVTMRTVAPDLTSAELVEQRIDAAPPGAVPWALGASGHRCCTVDLRAATEHPGMRHWLSEPRLEHEIGWSRAEWSSYAASTMLAERYDGVVYVNQVGPANPTPNARRKADAHQPY